MDPSDDINCDSLGRSLDLLDPLTKVTETGNMISIENDDDELFLWCVWPAKGD